MEMFLQASDTASERHEPRKELLRECAIHNKHDRAAKVKALYQRHVDLWVEFLGVRGMAPQDYELQKDSPTPNIALIKEFIWWYTISTKGRLRPDGRPAVITTLTCAERFFRGFATATGNMVAEEDRLEIYRWIRFHLYGPGNYRRDH